MTNRITVFAYGEDGAIKINKDKGYGFKTKTGILYTKVSVKRFRV